MRAMTTKKRMERMPGPMRRLGDIGEVGQEEEESPSAKSSGTDSGSWHPSQEIVSALICRSGSGRR